MLAIISIAFVVSFYFNVILWDAYMSWKQKYISIRKILMDSLVEEVELEDRQEEMK